MAWWKVTTSEVLRPEPIDLQGLVDDFATGLKRLDERRPQAANVRSGERYQPGIGPHTETQTLTLLAAEEAVYRAKRRLHAQGAG